MNMFLPSKQGGVSQTRYTGSGAATATNRIGHKSVLEDNYRATDGFKQMAANKKFANKKMSELP